MHNKTFPLAITSGIAAFALVSLLGASEAHAQSLAFIRNTVNGTATVLVTTAGAVLNQSPRPVYVNYQPPPPPVRYVFVDPAPRPGYVWVRGHHAWNGAGRSPAPAKR